MSITVELRMNGELLTSQEIGELEETIEYEFDMETEVEEEEEDEDFGTYDGGDEYSRSFINDYTTEDGERIHVTMRQHPIEYCEECGLFLEDEFFEGRGEVYDTRITKDPIYRAIYRFCSQKCYDHFFEHSMRTRYDNRSKYRVEFVLEHRGYDRFCHVLVNGTEVYTIKGYEFSHHIDEVPVLVLNLPLLDYEIKASPMGPGNAS